MKALSAVMATNFSDDILIPSGRAEEQAPSKPLAAFIPIVVAVAGVVAILFGGITAQNVVNLGSDGIDPTVTGSIAKAAVPTVGEVGHAR
jgi:hypothetical protein